MALLPDQQHEIARQNPVPDEDLFQAVDAIDHVIDCMVTIGKVVNDSRIEEMLNGTAEGSFVNDSEILTEQAQNLVGPDGLTGADSDHLFWGTAAFLQLLDAVLIDAQVAGQQCQKLGCKRQLRPRPLETGGADEFIEDEIPSRSEGLGNLCADMLQVLEVVKALQGIDEIEGRGR